MEVELVGAIAQMVALSTEAKGVTKEPYLNSVKLVAGTRQGWPQRGGANLGFAYLTVWMTSKPSNSGWPR